MSFAPTFGSLGDFISISILIKQVSQSLNDARGSTVEYRSLFKELDTLDIVVLQVSQACHAYLSGSQAHVLGEMASGITGQLQADIKDLKDHIEKYKSTLGCDSVSRIRGAIGRLRWLSEKEAFGKFREKFSSHKISLNLVLAVASL